jgi:hypothetical protein
MCPNLVTSVPARASLRRRDVDVASASAVQLINMIRRDVEMTLRGGGE